MSLPEPPVSLATELFDQRLATPVMAASGTCGFGSELAEVADLAWYGALALKTITLKPRKGNPPPRMTESPAGMLNSIGLQNPGWEEFASEVWPRVLETCAQTKLILSLGGEEAFEFATLAHQASDLEGVFALELNLSCPNVCAGGRVVGAQASAVRELVMAARGKTDLPLIAKLSPNVANLPELAQAAQEAGADAVSVVNTYLGLALDVEKRKYFFANRVAGVSGPAIKPLALRATHLVAQSVTCPVIGMGGISGWRDAAEFLLAGASAVQVGTAGFPNPKVAREICEGLAAYLKRQEMANIGELVGALQG
jgi:dihydroorotate dehydrogenase (NAD+) catalytic subunit